MEISGVVPAPTRDRSVRSAVHLHLPNAAERGSRARYSQVSTSTATKLFAHANQSNYPAQKVPLPNVASRPFTRSPCLFIAFLTRHEIRRLLPSAATSASVDGVFGDRELLPDPPREVRLRGGRQGCSVRPDLRGHDRQVRLAVGPGGRDGEKHHECRGAHLQDRTNRNEPGLRNRPGPGPTPSRSVLTNLEESLIGISPRRRRPPSVAIVSVAPSPPLVARAGRGRGRSGRKEFSSCNRGSSYCPFREVRPFPPSLR